MSEGATLRPAEPDDVAAIRALHDRVFGPGRFARTAFRIREGTPDVSAYCRLMLLGGTLVASIRMTPLLIGAAPGAALLGPLAVDPAHQRLTFGRRLIAAALAALQSAGIELVILVGDLDYYGPLGFVRVPPGAIVLPGPVDPRRVLACELVEGALTRFAGPVTADLDPRHWPA
ncbi:MAG: hypothetical protein RLZ98_2941 [Pseudomonadota bacterium]